MRKYPTKRKKRKRKEKKEEQNKKQEDKETSVPLINCRCILIVK